MLAKAFARLSGVPLERLLVQPVVSWETAVFHNSLVMEDIDAWRSGNTLLAVERKGELLLVDVNGLQDTDHVLW